MEKADHAKILLMAQNNPALKKLYTRHLKLDKTIKRLEQFSPYSPASALHNKDLKKQKLHGVEEMLKIISG